jgi:hypothetical protein
MAVTQYIPKSITYVYDNPETIEEYWEGSDVLMKKVNVAATWPVETGKDLGNAIQWAGGEKVAKQVVVDNSPIDNIKVIGLDIRGNGGRAYKVVINDLYYVDMREDVILDVMFETGIQAGGKLNGTFIWVKYGAQLKLVRIGSQLHKEFIIENERYESFVEIKPKDVEVGGLYEMKSGKILLYLGKMNYYRYYQNIKRGWSYSKDEYYDKHIVKEKSHVFLEMSSYEKPKKSIKDFIERKRDNLRYYLDFKTSIPKFVKKVKQIEENPEVEVAATLIREIAIKNDVKDYKNNQYAHNYDWKLCSCSANEPILPEHLAKHGIPVWKKPWENC